MNKINYVTLLEVEKSILKMDRLFDKVLKLTCNFSFRVYAKPFIFIKHQGRLPRPDDW